MQYKVVHNNVPCILPAFTKKVKMRMEEVNGQISDINSPLEIRMGELHGFLGEIIGEENLIRMLGSADLDEIDLNEMHILYLEVAKEYDRPIENFNKPKLDRDTEKILSQLADMAKSIESIDKVTSK